jgi:gluconate 2-dehydrogenase gamma chain
MRDHPISRRNLIKGLGLLPAAAASAPAAVPERDAYTPTFFNAAEWAFVIALCDRLIPHDDIGPGAVELGVPEFLDRHMQTPYASGDIWYMQGPFVDAGPLFGYQGRLPLRDMLRVGIEAIDRYCSQSFSGKSCAQLGHVQQETVLNGLEKDEMNWRDRSTGAIRRASPKNGDHPVWPGRHGRAVRAPIVRAGRLGVGQPRRILLECF